MMLVTDEAKVYRPNIYEKNIQYFWLLNDMHTLDYKTVDFSGLYAEHSPQSDVYLALKEKSLT